MAALGRILGVVARAPFAARTWRDTAYLVLGVLTAAVSFAILLSAGIVGGLMALTILGLPVLLGCFWLVRLVAHAERRRAILVLGAPIEARYRRPARPGVLARLGAAVRDRQTWKDLTWLLIAVPLSFSTGVAIVSVWLYGFWSASLLAWWWAAPNVANEVGIQQALPVESWPAAVGAAALGVAVCLVGPWIARVLALGEASLARALLGPGKRAALERRVTELAETRAGAVSVQAEELRRIERDLHDGAQARLVALAMDLGLAREKLGTEPEAAHALVATAHEEAKTAIRELRDLVRGIHPSILTDRGLDAALSALAARSRVPVALSVHLDERLPAAVEAAAYFVVNEALANVAKHSGASRCDVRVERTPDLLTIEVSDDGRGGADPGAGTGLRGLERRVRALDGRLVLHSPAGGPTVLRAEVPCAS